VHLLHSGEGEMWQNLAHCVDNKRRAGPERLLERLGLLLGATRGRSYGHARSRQTRTLNIFALFLTFTLMRQVRHRKGYSYHATFLRYCVMLHRYPEKLLLSEHRKRFHIFSYRFSHIWGPLPLLIVVAMRTLVL
jgi:hypothetical protein